MTTTRRKPASKDSTTHAAHDKHVGLKKPAKAEKPAKAAKPVKPEKLATPLNLAKPEKFATPAKLAKTETRATPEKPAKLARSGASLINPHPPSVAQPTVRVGIGGWTFEPWRGTFYPDGLPQSKELVYASHELTAIEINGTYYGLQKPATFAKWRDETPDGFVFSIKATRYATNRRVLAEAGDSIDRFVQSGITELGPKLGPIVWQFATTKAFNAEDFEAFLALLPNNIDSHALRHVLEVRHASFTTPEFVKLVRKYKMATVFTDSPDYPSFADLHTDFAYARLMCSNEKNTLGYAPKALDEWATRATTWAQGGTPDDLPRVEQKDKPARKRDVFVFFINGAKERAPHGARALISRLEKLSR